MAITEVGAGSQRAAYFSNIQQTTGAQAYPANVGNGNFLICAGRAYAGTAPTINSVATTRSANLTIIQAAVNANSTAWIAYGPATSAGACTVTVTCSAASYISYGIDEFAGQHATPFSVNGGSSTGTGTAASDGLTTLTSGELIIGVVGHTNGTVTITPTQTQIGEAENASQYEMFNTSFQIAGAAGAYTMNWTMGASVGWEAITASFKEASSGVNVSLTGTSETNSQGALARTADKVLTGQSDTGSIGNLTSVVTLALAGQSATDSHGTLTPDVSTNIALTGQSTTDSTGSLVSNADLSILGQEDTDSAGTITPDTAINIAITGQADTDSAGTLVSLASNALSGIADSDGVGALWKETTKALTGIATTESHGTITASGNIINAASPSQADVQAAINSAANGDTVQLPTGTATWATNVTIPNTKGIKLRGFSNTTTDTITLSSTLTPTTAESGNAQVRITNFRFVRQAAYAGNLIKMLGLAKTWRIDNIVFDDNNVLATETRTIEIGVKGSENGDDYNYGVIDNCQFIGRNSVTNLHVNWVRWGALQLDQVASGDYIWTLNPDRGSARAVYVEDCTFSDHASATATSQICDTQYAGQIVIRNCTIQNPWISTHSGMTNGGRNTPWTEVYNNTFTQDANQYTGYNIEFRSSSGVIYNNTSVNTWDAGVDHERSWRTDGAGAYGGKQDGTRAFDQNSGTAGWRGLGQPGWGPPQVNDMSAYTFSGVFCLDNISNGSQLSLDIYNDTQPPAPNYTTDHLQAGREVFRDANVTKGLIANRPTTCNPGPSGRSVYVSTDENAQGIVIYVCLSTNVWTKHWEPFTYPHPQRLDAGSGEANLSGQSSTDSQGGLTSTVSIELTGLSDTVSQGALSSEITSPISGQLSADATGSLANEAISLISGLSTTDAHGTLVPLSGVDIALTGQADTNSQGSLISSWTGMLAGQEDINQQGSMSAQTDSGVSLTGQSESNIQSSLIAGVSIEFAGQQTSESLGGLFSEITSQLNGNEEISSTGTLSPQIGFDVALTGQVINEFLGEFTLSSNIVLSSLQDNNIQGSLGTSGGEPDEQYPLNGLDQQYPLE